MITRFLTDKSGGTALEYALIASIISIAIVGSITQWSDGVVALFALIEGAFTP